MTAGLIVALDAPDLAKAEALAKELAGSVSAFKVGLSLFGAHGPEAILEIGQHGRVFCDLKLHDIPHQVRSAASALASLGVWMFTVHASGGAAMIRAAVEGAGSGEEAPIVAGVTVLTSLSAEDLAAVGQVDDPLTQVARLARVAAGAGARAVVCSGREVARVREEVGPGVIVLVPGVRPEGTAKGDQSRVTTPEEAAASGADYVVVGRPITDAPDPAEAARRILDQLLR